MVSALPKAVTGQPLLLGKHLDGLVQEYISALRKAGGIVNTSLVLGAAEGIVTAKNPGLLAKHGGHIELTKSWAKSLFQRMGYVKRKGSNHSSTGCDYDKQIFRTTAYLSREDKPLSPSDYVSRGMGYMAY